jgi:hypothetical protein
MKYYRPLKSLLDQWHPFLECPCLLKKYPNQGKKWNEWKQIYHEIHPWRAWIIDKEDDFLNWFEWVLVHYSFTLPKKLKKTICLFCSRLSMKLGVWESFKRKTPYAVGGTLGWKFYCYFSKKV